MATRAQAGAIVIGVIVAAGLIFTGMYNTATPPGRGGLASPAGEGDIRFTATTERPLVTPEEPVRILATTLNTGRNPVSLRFADSCHVTYTVWAEDGSLVYDRTLHEVCSPTAIDVILWPSEGVRSHVVWNQVGDDGQVVPADRTYRIHLVLRTADVGSRFETDVVAVVGPDRPTAGLRLEALADADQYRLGELVNVTIVLTNLGTKAIEVYSPDSCLFAFYVLDWRGLVVYRIPPHVDCLAIISGFTLAPGASYRALVARWNLKDSWGGDLVPGRYLLCPTLLHAEVAGDITEVYAMSFLVVP